MTYINLPSRRLRINSWTHQIYLSLLLCATLIDFFPKPDLTRLLPPISQYNNIISSWPMILHQIQVIACHKGSVHRQSDIKSKPWVLRQTFCGLSPMQCIPWNLMVMGLATHWLVILPSLHLCAPYQGLFGMCGLWTATKTWNTIRIFIASKIGACLKEKCFLTAFSITCTSKAKNFMVMKKLSMLQYSCVLSQVGPGERKHRNKESKTANSANNPNARPDRIPRDNHLSWLGSET